MAKSKRAGDDRRVGAVKGRSQSKSEITGSWTKRNEKTGKFMDVKANPKSTKVMERTVERFAGAMKSLAKR